MFANLPSNFHLDIYCSNSSSEIQMLRLSRMNIKIDLTTLTVIIQNFRGFFISFP